MEQAAVDAVIELVARATGVAAADVAVAPRPPLEHQSNRLYDVRTGGQRLIAKEFVKPDEHATAPVREHGALARLARLDIAPQPVLLAPAATPSLGPVVVYHYLAGETWERRTPTAAQLRRLAETWLALHAAPTDGLWPSRGHERTVAQAEAWFRAGFAAYDAWAAAEFPAGRPALDLCLELLERFHPLGAELADHEPVLCFCRSDARFANVVERPDGRVGMVDWEDSGLRDPARDLADLANHPDQEDRLSPDRLGAFLDTYIGARAAVDPRLARRMHLYLAAFPLFWLASLLPRGVALARASQLAGWSINGMPADQRLRRYLARALAWPEEDVSDAYASLAGITFFPAD